MPLSRRLHLTFLGCGHIGKALLGALLPSITKPSSPIAKITVALKRQESYLALQSQFHNTGPVSFVYRQNTQAVQDADAILLAFPPDQIHDVLGSAGMREALKRKTIISLLARTPRAELERGLQGGQEEGVRIIRAMPTIGTEILESATLLAIPGTGTAPGTLTQEEKEEEEALELATWIFTSVGKVFRLSDDQFDTATGISAFSNALATVAIQMIAEKAVAEGIPVEHAISITSQCIRGTVGLISSGVSPGVLERSLSAPGSITGQAIEGLKGGRLEEVLGGVLERAVVRARDTGDSG
ncbi:hypothetical protein BJX99DRAFT_259976 [Aspergillus californicus]